MNSLEGIIAANRAADRSAVAKAASAKRTKAGEVAAEKYHAKQVKLDKSGRLAR